MKLILTLSFAFLCINSFAQETLQSVTDRGTATNKEIQFRSVANPNKYAFVGGHPAYARIGAFDVTTGFDNLIIEAANIGIGTITPTTKLNIAIGAGAANGTVGLKIGSVDNYPSLELGIENDYDAQIRTYGNDLKIYAGHFRNVGNVSTEDHKINFYTSKKGSTNWSLAKMVLTADGYLAIGTNSPTDMLTVAGKIGAREIKVTTNAGADFVFEPGYKLPALPELEKYVKTNKHLPEIPTAEQMLKEGVNLGELNIKLLQKVEELTLHLIEKDKQLQNEAALIKTQQVEIEALKKGYQEIKEFLATQQNKK